MWLVEEQKVARIKDKLKAGLYLLKSSILINNLVKLAHIVPIHKKENKNNVQNYRPISLTCIISKVFEKCIRDEILLHCQHLLNDSQHGFLPLRSCTTQLVPFAHDISLGLNSNHLMDIIYFDFAKAFDTVNHDIILQKLKDDFKIDGLMLKYIKE